MNPCTTVPHFDVEVESLFQYAYHYFASKTTVLMLDPLEYLANSSPLFAQVWRPNPYVY